MLRRLGDPTRAGWRLKMTAVLQRRRDSKTVISSWRHNSATSSLRRRRRLAKLQHWQPEASSLPEHEDDMISNMEEMHANVDKILSKNGTVCSSSTKG